MVKKYHPDSAKAEDKKQFNYFMGRKYYEAGLSNLDKFHSSNSYLDVNALLANTAKTVNFYYGAMKCFNYVINNASTDYLRQVAEGELNYVYSRNIVISRQLAAQPGMELLDTYENSNVRIYRW